MGVVFFTYLLALFTSYPHDFSLCVCALLFCFFFCLCVCVCFVHLLKKNLLRLLCFYCRVSASFPLPQHNAVFKYISYFLLSKFVSASPSIIRFCTHKHWPTGRHHILHTTHHNNTNWLSSMSVDRNESVLSYSMPLKFCFLFLLLLDNWKICVVSTET